MNDLHIFGPFEVRLGRLQMKDLEVFSYKNTFLFGSRHLFELYLYLKFIFLVFHFKLDGIRGSD